MFDISKIKMPHTEVEFKTADSKWQRVYDAAESIEKNNVRSFSGRNALIEGGAYNGLWLETQPMGGEMYAKRNVDVALNNQLFFMENIRSDGRIPSVIRNKNGELDLMFSHFQGYCFPYHALNMYYWIGKNADYLKLLLETLIAFDNYLWKTRDSDGDGCLETWCEWDTGEDNSTRFAGAPSAWGEDIPPLGHGKVPYESMDIMAYSYDGRKTVSEIYEILGDSENAKLWKAKADAVAAKIKDYLWIDAKNACFDRDCNNEFMDVLIHNNLRVMYHGAFSQDMADRFVKNHLLNPEEFWTPMPLPSIAVNESIFRNHKKNDWSGQPEGLTYQRAIRALENYGHFDIVAQLGHKLCDAIALNDPIYFTQQFDPFTCEPSVGEGNDYGPTILAFLEYTAHMYGVYKFRDKMVWNMAEAGNWEYSQLIDGKKYTLIAEGSKGSCLIDGKKVSDISVGERFVL